MIKGNPDPDKYKWCTLGQHFALRTDFSKSLSRSDGLSNFCNSCNSARSKVYHRQVRLNQRFGVTAEQFDIMFAQQEGRCAVCKEEPESTLCVDHDHVTGKVRRLLCNRCNRVLGIVEDDPKILKNMIDYLTS